MTHSLSMVIRNAVELVNHEISRVDNAINNFEIDFDAIEFTGVV